MPAKYPKDLAELLKLYFGRRRGLPTRQVLASLIEVAFFASLGTEESMGCRCSLVWARPEKPDPRPPLRIRPHRWQFSALDKKIPLTPRNLIKLAPVDQNAGAALAAYHSNEEGLYIWGLVDQVLHTQRSRLFEADSGFGRPGAFELEILGAGHVAAFDDRTFIAALRASNLNTYRLDPLHSGPVFHALFDHVDIAAAKVLTNLANGELPADDELDSQAVYGAVADSWIGCLCRILHLVRRRAHGGALLLTPTENNAGLKIKHGLRYHRLAELHVERAEARVAESAWELVATAEDDDTGRISSEPHYAEWSEYLRGVDADLAIDGAVEFVAGLASIDGLVLMGPGLSVRGFGVEIVEKDKPMQVFAATDSDGTASRLRPLIPTSFGTRHRSMFRFCWAHPKAVGLVVSQDGDVRIVKRIKNRLIVWDNPDLYNYEPTAFQAEVQKRSPRFARGREG